MTEQELRAEAESPGLILIDAGAVRALLAELDELRGLADGVRGGTAPGSPWVRKPGAATGEPRAVLTETDYCPLGLAAGADR